MGMGVLTVIGNMTQDVEIKTSSADKPYCRFNIAVNSGFGDRKRTDYLTCLAFGKTAENIAKFFSKGKQIIVHCQPQQNKYTNKEGKNVSEIVFLVQNFEFPAKSSSHSDSEETDGRRSSDGFISVPDDMDDEMLPFS